MYSERDFERPQPIAGSERFAEEKYRSGFRRDSARLIHSPSFRRLQGKTQLFPGMESDYFRNRLTHSLEVGQIAKSIAIRLNATQTPLDKTPLDVDLVELAGWAHDLGHPPFGHQGERALNKLMADAGGFEGNAQTLRILTKLEKRERASEDLSGIDDRGVDMRMGLNLTARTLAAVLKYDKAIPQEAGAAGEAPKGYYNAEATDVKWIKRQVAPGATGEFKTIECQIMDVADDIAYSTYDLEDTLKAGFVHPLDMVEPEQVLARVAEKASKGMGRTVNSSDVVGVLLRILSPLADPELPEIQEGDDPATINLQNGAIIHRAATRLARNGYIRSEFTSRLVRAALDGVEFEYNPKHPALSTVRLRHEERLQVEVLKHFTYETTIRSPRVSVSQVRATEIVGCVFDALQTNDQLLPDDVREIYGRVNDDAQRRRVVCDFVAGMTDRYALEFYGRLRSENPQTIFKPL